MTTADPTRAGTAAPSAPARRFFWQRFADGSRPDGADLAALRRGVNREPGSVPQMWRYYTTLTADGRLTAQLVAEHLALTLFAVHQQSRTEPMHRDGVGLGLAVRELKRPGRFSEDAVDRRFAAAATATSLPELAVHLRGLVGQLRSANQPLDYTRLTADLRDWQSPDRSHAVRRRWGGAYFAPPGLADDPPLTHEHELTAASLASHSEPEGLR